MCVCVCVRVRVVIWARDLLGISTRTATKLWPKGVPEIEFCAESLMNGDVV